MYCVNLKPDLNASQVGAKAANLGKALSMGLPVPDAFVITRAALTFFLEETGMRDRVEKYLKEHQLHDRVARKQAFESLRSAVLETLMPEELREEVSAFAKECLEFAPAGLAVRSSGFSEDSEKASFAGVYESFLCLSSVGEIWDSIRKCWCSAWSPHAIDYALKMEVELEPDHMAVIVQQVVAADSAGVIFTAGTLTGNPWRFVLNSTFGLAQDLVNGTATADHLVLEWDTGRILSKRIAEKPRALVPSGSGLKQIQLPDSKKKATSVSNETARRIARLALDLDRMFNLRVDVEWAVEGDEVFLIQVRPITALPEFFPHNLSGPDAEISWKRRAGGYASEQDVVPPFFRGIWESECWTRYQPEDICLGYLEYRERDFFGYRYKTRPRYRDWADIDSLERWLDTNEAKLRKQWLRKKQEIQETLRLALAAQKKECRVGDLIPDLLLMHKLMPDNQAMIYGAPQTMFIICEDELLRPLIKNVVPEFVTENLLQGIPSYSYERTEAAQDLGKSIREDAVKAAFAKQPLHGIIPHLLEHYPECQFLKDYEAYCWRYGIFPHTWMSRPPMWSTFGVDDANQQLLVIKHALIGKGGDIRRHFEECVRKRKASETEIRCAIQHKQPGFLARFDKVLDWTQFWVPALDDRTWNYLSHYSLLELIWQTGVRLQKAGLVNRPVDVQLFSPEELECIGKADRDGKDICEYRELLDKRKRELERYGRLTPPDFIGAYVKPPPRMEVAQQELDAKETNLGKGTVLKGQGFTQGRVTGIARKAENLKDPALLDSLKDEDILVCLEGSFDNHTDWLSLFMIVRGLVTVEGCADNHSVQIARECDVTFINLPKSGPASIPDNAQIVLDGEAGTVTILGV